MTVGRLGFFFAVILAFVASSLMGTDIALTGVDSRLLPVTGAVNLYVVATDDEGMLESGLDIDDFQVRDASAEEELGDALPLSGFSPAGAPRDGISFMMLIDDSGSMYDGPDGRSSPVFDNTRAALARREARRFLEDLGSSDDRAGLALFGTRYRILAGPRTDRATLTERLGVSAAPESEEAYTELYAGIAEAAGSLAGQRGRRIVILFSDGENYPYAERSGRPHPEYGEKSHVPTEALEALQEEAVTLYAVRFGSNRDEALAEIAAATGGLVFDVDGEEELTGLYASIRDRVAAEYRLSYRPQPKAASRSKVQVEIIGENRSGVLEYPSLIVFGAPSSKNAALLSLIALPSALIVLLILGRLRAAERLDSASLLRLRPVPGSPSTVALSPGKTLLSPGDAGGATQIHTDPGKMPARGNTIVVEKGKDGRWRASSDAGVTVNNKTSESTVLEDGDVIRAGDELIVFDDGED